MTAFLNLLLRFCTVHIVIFENFVKSMTSCLAELKVTPTFCFAFKIHDNVTATSHYHSKLILRYLFGNEKKIWPFCCKSRNGILLPKLFWPTVRKNCSSDWEKLLKFKAEGKDFAKFLNSLEQFIQTVSEWFLTCSERFFISNKLEQLDFKLEKILLFRNMQEK